MKEQQVKARRDVIIELKRLATISIYQQEWVQFEPRIIQFQTKPRPNINVSFTLKQEILERIAVKINLGKRNRIIEGMTFQIRDTIDETSYGIIVVKEVHQNGSTCEIVDIADDEAFWSEALIALEEKRPKIVDAPKNIIIAAFSIDLELAKELLSLLDRVQIPE